ncbi:RNase adapter RapZ [Parasphingorhabdus flavimaris]|uniref:RNase adapter RapZ n=1 Tax=Parasphingorhabdus flavimaris TaxID=266812 RepID=A0ABX2N1X2_9SPHN|nr:RNase adapter RapZ [Parasphingorhabdus flavimaris]NVD27685.1 RNase adapter RapZ [Parasphingorhabdus flavimaris]|tara:strand:+ start:5658 stop:6593 length:936 start_codon:yes stop_codon:yes gene_type:complete
MTERSAKRVLLVTGLSGAGKTTALKTMEDIGWETVDNFPFRLVESLLNTPPSSSRDDNDQPLALGFDSRTRGFEPDKLINSIKRLQKKPGYLISTLFLDCAGAELERRYAETRRRHPLALDRPAKDGIAHERTLLAPFRRWADHVIDTSDLTANDLQREIREHFSLDKDAATTITITSFGFSRGLPNNIDLLFDVRFLANPFWVPELKQKTGLDPEVAEYVSKDPAYAEAIEKIMDMLTFLLPRYQEAGKAYVNIGIGCTGGRHRSVHVAERLSKDLRSAGFSPNVLHRNLASPPMEALESMQKLNGNRGI